MSRLSEETFYEHKTKTSGKVPEKNLWSVGNITIDYRTLHYFLVYVLVLRHSNHATIIGPKMQFLYVVNNEIHVN